MDNLTEKIKTILNEECKKKKRCSFETKRGIFYISYECDKCPNNQSLASRIVASIPKEVRT